MSNSKRERSASVKQNDVNQVPVQEIKAGNGKSKDTQFAGEVKKLDQIRDMLFGDHVAALQSDYQSLDKSLDKNISALRKELNESINDVKKKIDKNFEQLQNSLQTEESDRMTANDELNASLSRVNSDILTKIELETKRIDQALNEQQKETSQKLTEMMSTLQDKKVDRKSLAAMFGQIAKELEDS